MAWERWKQKIKNLFLTEPEDEEEIPPYEEHAEKKIQKQHRYQQIQSKVKYQYPNKKSFRFPIIPDMPERSSSEEPLREERRQYAKKRNEPEKPREQPTQKREKTEPEQKPRQKEPSKPFRPSEVPSPIHGFQDRGKRDIEDVPAFVRKEAAVQQEEPVLQGEINNTDPDDEYTTEIQEIEVQPEEVEEKTPVFSEQDHEIAVTLDDEAAPVQGEEEDVEAAVPMPVSDNNPETEISEPKPSEPKPRPKEKTQSGSKQVPFNVMMTPLDKKKLMDRKRAEQQKQQKQQKQQQQQKQQKQQKTIPERKQVPVPYHLLDDPEEANNDDQLWINSQQELLEKTLKHFKVRAKVVAATKGPSVTRFEVQPELGVKVSKVRNLSDDLKLNMAAKDIRIEAPIPGKNTIGIEVPNPNPQMVALQEVFETDAFKENESPLAIALGLDIEGSAAVTNIAKMPHGLIAGATGSGKSVCINTILISLLYKAHHDDVKFLLIDPKMVELAPYNGIPHLVSPVITDVKAATAALKWAVSEMEERYEKFVDEGVRDIERYNQKIKQQGRTAEKMPFIVIVIDELSDLMMVSPQDVEDAICRIAQKARACGIHLLVATQRPSVDVITGLIKANIPTRIAFSVSSQVDSRTIIDNAGAEKLLGRGDMLFVENGTGKSVRLQGAFVSDEEIERVATYARSIAAPEYLFEQEQLLEQMTVDEEEDVLLSQVIEFIMEQNTASTSLLQRQFKIGYNRAARLIDTMENRGIISQQNGSKPRDVLLSGIQLDEVRQ